MELTFRLRQQPHSHRPKAEGLLEKEFPVPSPKVTTPNPRQCSQHLPRVHHTQLRARHASALHSWLLDTLAICRGSVTEPPPLLHSPPSSG